MLYHPGDVRPVCRVRSFPVSVALLALSRAHLDVWQTPSSASGLNRKRALSLRPSPGSSPGTRFLLPRQSPVSSVLPHESPAR